MKLKKCKICPQEFEPRNGFQKVCSPRCAFLYGKAEVAERNARERSRDRKKLKSRHEHLKSAQFYFNRFIRLRDAGANCISCGAAASKSNPPQAGHFRSVGACPELRFSESNCYLQCCRCNMHKSGNHGEYRKALVEKIGADAVAEIEGPHEPKKYTIEEIDGIRDKYKAKCKELGAT